MQILLSADRIRRGADHGGMPSDKGGVRDCGACLDLHLSFDEGVKHEGSCVRPTEGAVVFPEKDLRHQKSQGQNRRLSNRQGMRRQG